MGNKVGDLEWTVDIDDSKAREKLEKYKEYLKQMDNDMSSLHNFRLPNLNFSASANDTAKLQARIKELSSQLDELRRKFEKLGGGNGPKTTETVDQLMQINKRIQEIMSHVDHVTKKLKSQDETYGEMIDKLARAQGELVKIRAVRQAINKAEREGTITSAQAVESRKKLVEAELQHSQVSKTLMNSLRVEEKRFQSVTGSINEMAANLDKMRIVYRNLSDSERSGSFGTSLLNDIQQLDVRVKSLDASIGNYQRNVGHYALAWDGLGYSIQQVAREIPNVAYGSRVFFMAISNNIPILADEIKKARLEFEAAKQAGQTAVPVWKRVLKSIFSWQTLLVAGITLLTLYGDKLVNWVSELINGKKALDAVGEAQKKLNEASIEGSKNAQEELMKLKLLSQAAEDTNLSQEKRNEAARKLQQMYPEYLGNLTIEQIKLGQVGDAYVMMAKNITKAAQARVAFDKLVEAAKEEVELRESFNELQKNGPVFNIFPDDDKSYIETIKERIKLLQKEIETITKNAELTGRRANISDQNKELLKLNEIIAAYDAWGNKLKEMEEISKGVDPFSIVDSKGSDNGIKKFTDLLRQQVDAIQAAQSQYEKYLEIMSSQEAVNKVRSLTQFKDLDFNPNEVEKRISKVYKKLGNSEEEKRLKEHIESVFTDIDFSKLKKNFDETLKFITSEVSSYKEKYSVYEKLLGITGDRNLSLNIAFGGDMEAVGGGIVEKIKQGINEALKENKVELTLDQVMNFDFTKSAEELGIGSKLKDFLEKSVGELKQVDVSSLINFQKLVQEYATVEEKISNITANGEMERLKITETYEKLKIGASGEYLSYIEQQERAAIEASKKKQEDAISSLKTEMLSISDFWKEIFSDMSNKGYNDLVGMAKKAKDVIDQASSQPVKDKDGKTTGFKFSMDGKEYEMTMSMLEHLRKRMIELNKASVKKNPFKAFFDALKNGPKEGQKMSEFLLELNGKMQEAIGMVNQLGESVSSTFSALGNEDAAQAVNDIASGLEGSANSAMGLARVATGDLTGIIQAAQGISQIVTTIAGAHDRKLNKQIEESEKRVRKLQWAYEDLERAVDKGLTETRFESVNAQIRNLVHQQKELAYQADKERDKKKTDKDKVADLKRQIVELGNEISDLLDNLRDEIVGSTAKDIARQLGDAFIDAFARGEDAAKAWGDSVDEIIANMVRNMLVAKYLEEPIQNAINDMWEKMLPGQARAKDLTQKIKAAQERIKNIDDGTSGLSKKEAKKEKEKLEKEVSRYLTQLKQTDTSLENVNWDAASEGAENFKKIGEDFKKFFEQLPDDVKEFFKRAKSSNDLSRDIKGVTEDTASLIASYMNAIRQYVSLQQGSISTINANVAAILAKMGGDMTQTTSNGVLRIENLESVRQYFVPTENYLQDIAINVESIYDMQVKCQLHLANIEANTLKNAQLASDIMDLLKRVSAPVGSGHSGYGLKIA